ncbi:MAG: hypothetical protein U1C74_20685 [Phenylobacterium sp.]|nr:hypothetical protein [Phenylobacterium sp.]
MSRIRCALALAALCFVATPALAQKTVGAPGNIVPQTAVAFGAVGQTAQAVTADNPLPVQVISGGSGGGTGDASEETLQGVLDEIAGLRTDLAEPADSLPPQPPVAAASTTLTAGYNAITASGDTTLVTATSAQSTRVHRMHCTIIPASGTVTVTFKSATTTLKAFKFPATGGFINWSYSPYWHLKTANNEALVLTSSATADINCAYDYVKGA